MLLVILRDSFFPHKKDSFRFHISWPTLEELRDVTEAENADWLDHVKLVRYEPT